MVGAGGRMGQEVCRAVSEAADLELVAAIDPGHVGADACGRTIVGEVNALADLGAEVVVDFTIAEAVRHNVTHYAVPGHPRRHRDERAVRGRHGRHGGAASPGARTGPTSSSCPTSPSGRCCCSTCARIAAPHMDGVEIIELHHDAKRDAPSGTAMHTAAVIAAARRAAGSAALPAGSDHRHGAAPAPAVPRPPTACTCTRCGCPASWPTRRSSSVRRARA